MPEPEHGDVQIMKDSETLDDIAVPTHVVSSADDLVCGYQLAIIRPKNNTNGSFLKFFFVNPGTRYYFSFRASGATRFGLTLKMTEEVPIQILSLTKQEKITTVTATAEREAGVLARSLEALRVEQEALMQRLLTTKRRVKLAEKSHA